jgi:uncharacterized RDD family membrane protein YckC
MYWYYAEDEIQIGPLTDSEFEELVRIGKIEDATMVWHDGLAGWQSYGSLRNPQPVPVAGTSMPVAISAAAPALKCSQCHREFPADDLIRYQDSWICSNCKPLFFQRLREGLPAPGTFVYAGFWIRAGAKMIDFVILWIAEMAFLFALMPIFGISFFSPARGTAPNLAFLLIYPFLIGFSFAYSVYFVGKYGATPGKMALGLKIVSSSGQPVGYGKAFARMLGEMLSGLICYMGYIMVAFNDEKKALHDQICDTRVIRK